MKKKKWVISSVFLVFVIAVFISSFYYAESDDDGMSAVSARAVAKIDSFTNTLSTLPGLMLVLIITVTVIIARNYSKKKA